VQYSIAHSTFQVKPLFAVAEAVWNGSAEPIAGITHPDILRFLLQIDSVCCEAALCNVACINAGKINGKMALYCVSELRVAITRLSSQASQDGDLVEETIHSVLEIGRALTAPILEGGYELHSYTTCLELLPVVVETLATLQRFDVHSGGDYLAHEMLLNDVFGVQWEGALVLPLSSILCELYPHLSKDNLRSFEVRTLHRHLYVEFVRYADCASCDVAVLCVENSAHPLACIVLTLTTLLIHTIYRKSSPPPATATTTTVHKVRRVRRVRTLQA